MTTNNNGGQDWKKKAKGGWIRLLLAEKIWLISEVLLAGSFVFLLISFFRVKLLLNKEQYISLLQWHVYVIYPCFIFGLILSIRAKLFKNPPGDNPN